MIVFVVSTVVNGEEPPISLTDNEGQSMKTYTPSQAFLAAAEMDDLENLKTLLKDEYIRRNHMTMKNEMEDIAFFAAAANGSISVVRYFIEELGYDINMKDHDGATIYHVSAWHGHTTLVDYLISLGVDKHALCNNGWSSLFGAARWHELGMVQHLLTIGVSPDTQETKHGFTALMLGAGNGDTALVDILLASKADISKVDYNKRTAQMIANQQGHMAIVDKLDAVESHVGEL